MFVWPETGHVLRQKGEERKSARSFEVRFLLHAWAEAKGSDLCPSLVNKKKADQWRQKAQEYKDIKKKEKIF